MREITQYTSLSARAEEEFSAFLRTRALDFTAGAEAYLAVHEEGELIAVGIRHGNILKDIAVHPRHEGEGLSALVVSELVKDAVSHGIAHLFLFTKPKNERQFAGLGFYEVARTEDVLMLENRRGGVERYVNSLPRWEGEGTIGALVMHCNPMTLGHLHLIEQAARECAFAYLFILSEETGTFSAAQRKQWVEEATAHLPNLHVAGTADYLISHATFPDYFFPDKAEGRRANCLLDLTVFLERFAKPLGITRRYVGEEPFSPVTADYNEQMLSFLPQNGVEVRVLPRYAVNGSAVSATEVRRLLASGDLDAIAPLVPKNVLEGLKNHV